MLFYDGGVKNWEQLLAGRKRGSVDRGDGSTIICRDKTGCQKGIDLVSTGRSALIAVITCGKHVQ